MSEPVRPLTDAVRELIELATSTAVPADAVQAAADELRSITDRLRALTDGEPRPYHFEMPDGRDPGSHLRFSPVAGPCNPLAPPLALELRDGMIRGTVTFGRAYEGPPGYVHGGFLAAVFDEVLGVANLVSGNPGMTVRLDVRYLLPTPLRSPIVVEGRHTGREGRRIFATGSILAGGEETARAEAVFAEITPARARTLFAGGNHEHAL